MPEKNDKVGMVSYDDGPYRPVARETLPEGIALQILTLIGDQELRPGDKLPPERDLARLLGVSRPVVREALRALSIMNIIAIRQGAGTFVTSLEPQELVSHLGYVFSGDAVSIGKLFEARRILEVGNARLAALRITDDVIDRLEEVIVRAENSLHDEREFMEFDIQFHDAVSEAADNFLLARFMRITKALGRASRAQTGSRLEVRELTLRSLGSILEGLRARDPEQAASAMKEHLDQIEGSLQD